MTAKVNTTRLGSDAVMKNNVTSMSNANVGKAFNAVIKGKGRDDVGEILFNWNESELNYDGDRIICYPGRDGRYSRGKEGGKSYVSKREFLAWIFSDDPFDEKVYGSEIRNNSEWVSLILRARDAALMENHALKSPKIVRAGYEMLSSCGQLPL